MSTHTPEFSKEELSQETERLRGLLKKADNAWEAVEEFAINKGDRKIGGTIPKLETALLEVARQTLQGNVNGNDSYMVGHAVRKALLPKREQSV